MKEFSEVIRDANRAKGGGDIDAMLVDGILFRRQKDGTWEPPGFAETTFGKAYLEWRRENGKCDA